jgi:hypothetical protein
VLLHFPLQAYPGVDMQGLNPRFNVGRQELKYYHVHDLVIGLAVQRQINVDWFEPVL